MFENIVIGLFGLLMVNYLVIFEVYLIIILCIACVFDLWRHNRSGKITADDKRMYDTFIGRIKFIVMFLLVLCGVASVIHYFG